MKVSTFWPLALASASLVSASPVIARPHARRSCSHGVKNATQTSDVTEADLSRFNFYRQWAGASYCNDDGAAGTRVVCGENACPDVEAHNATIIGSLSDKTLTSIEGFVGIDDVNKEVVLSFRGSISVRNWIADLDFSLDDQCEEDLGYPGCEVHSGFLNAWQNAEPQATSYIDAAFSNHTNYKLVVTGHSLGAATATVAAAYLRKAGRPCDLYTYGSPRVGNEQFVEYMMAPSNESSNYRFTHFDDPVPRTPPTTFLFGSYRHISPEYWLMPDNVTSLTAADIKVCKGTKNDSCNAGTSGLDIAAHKQYFGYLSACGNTSYQI